MKRIFPFILLLAVILTVTGIHLQARNNRSITVAAAGDVMLGHMMQTYLDQYGYSYPFFETGHLLTAADIALCNLEGPLSERGEPMPNKRFVFRVSPEAINGLLYAGIDVCILANNHILDYGNPAVEDTVSLLNSRSILPVGYGDDTTNAFQYKTITVKGSKIGILAFNQIPPDVYLASDKRSGTACGTPERIAYAVSEAEKYNDFVIVNFHWGTEYEHFPENEQRPLAYAAIDAGADMVIGHHPHVIGIIETYKNIPIFYSLGNYTFGYYYTTFEKLATVGLIIQADITDNAVGTVRLYPINVNNIQTHYMPRLLSPEDCRAAVEQIGSLSKPYNTEIIFDSSLNCGIINRNGN